MLIALLRLQRINAHIESDPCMQLHKLHACVLFRGCGGHVTVTRDRSSFAVAFLFSLLKMRELAVAGRKLLLLFVVGC